MSRHCYIETCPHGDYRLKRWAGVRCSMHNGAWRGDPPCTCEPPFRLLKFPVKALKPEQRLKWLEAIKRVDPKKTEQWLEPTRSMVVCSRHFVDGKVTVEHPFPELYLQSNTIARPSASKSRRSRKRRFDDRHNGEEIVTDIVKMEIPLERIPPNKPKLIIVLGLRFIIHILMSIIRKLRKEKEEIEKENVVLKKLLSDAKKRRTLRYR